MRLFRLNIEVGDIAHATDFYTELLGLEGRRQMGSRCYFDAGGVTLQIVQAEPVHSAAKALYFAADDLDAVHARAAGLGCLSAEKVHGMPGGEPVVRPWGERNNNNKDPKKNPHSFVEQGTVYAG